MKRLWIFLFVFLTSLCFSCDPSRVHQWEITNMLSEKALSVQAGRDVSVLISNELSHKLASENKKQVICVGIVNFQDRLKKKGVLWNGLNLNYQESMDVENSEIKKDMEIALKSTGFKVIARETISEYLKANDISQGDLMFPEKSAKLKKDLGVDFLLYFQIMDYQRSYAWTVEKLPTLFKIFGKIRQDTVSVRGKAIRAENGYIEWIDEVKGMATLTQAFRSDSNDRAKGKVIEIIEEYKNAVMLNNEFVSEDLLEELEKFQTVSEDNMDLIHNRIQSEQKKLEILLDSQ